MSGEVVGITTQKEFFSSDGRPLQGIGFALSAQDLIEKLRGFDAKLSPATPFAQQQPVGAGKVTISSNVPGAELYVDAAFIGNAPSTLRLPAGTHKIEVKMDGYASWTRDLHVMDGSELTVNANLVSK
jgi:hypothetical protein